MHVCGGSAEVLIRPAVGAPVDVPWAEVPDRSRHVTPCRLVELHQLFAALAGAPMMALYTDWASDERAVGSLETNDDGVLR
jgi:hypothetical protein